MKGNVLNGVFDAGASGVGVSDAEVLDGEQGRIGGHSGLATGFIFTNHIAECDSGMLLVT